MINMMKDSIIKGEVTGMAFGGQGIVRHEGLVVFVPFTSIGDIISCRITQKKSSFANAEIVEIHNPSQQRIVPKCPYFGKCGGCQLQHLTYSSQLEYKRQCIEDALIRIGKMPSVKVPLVIPSEKHWAYRRHISLTLKSVNEAFEVGYIATDNRTLIPVTQCPIFVDTEDQIICNVRTFIAQLKNKTANNEGKATLFKLEKGKYLIHLQFKSLPANCSQVLESALQLHSTLSGIVASSPHKTLVFGAPTARLNIDGLSFKFSPHVFVQNHPEQSLNIYREICRLARNANAKKILDLYCGIGISGIMLAKQGAGVFGVEANPAAIQLAKENAAQNSIENVRFQQGDVQALLKKLLQQECPDFVVVNPPRTGLDPRVINILLANPPKEVVYISCMPSTLARDLRLLCAEDRTYQVASCQGFDMFPQTAHVETLVHLKY